MKTIKQLERAAKLYKEIKVIDAQIIELDKWAIKIANEGFKISIDISFEERQKQKEVSFDLDGSLIFDRQADAPSMFTSIFQSFMPYGYNGQEKKKDENSIKKVISESTCLIILGGMLSELMDNKHNIINELKKIGIEL